MMRKKKRMAMSLFLIGMLLGGCDKKTEYTERFFAMDTYMSMTIYGEGAKEAFAQAKSEIDKLEKILSVTDDESEVFRINQSTEEEQIITEEVETLLSTAKQLHERTNGALDVTLYPVLKLWGFTTRNYQVPKEEELEEARLKTGMERLILEGDRLCMESGTEIDFGALAKGYAGKKAAMQLKKAGITSAILNLGGNVQTVGLKPDGSKWKVALKDPEQTESYAGILTVDEKAIVTSGGYERYFEDDNGNKWGHILDPKTGYPAESGLLSVTIVGEDGTVCDALSTAFYVMGIEKAEEYWRKYGGFEAIFITTQNEIYLTEGLEQAFVPAGNYEEQEVKVIR